MSVDYKALAKRTPNGAYRRSLRTILRKGRWVKDTPQGMPALTCFGQLAPMEFDLRNGIPLITERSMKNFWQKPIAEIIAFVNGARTLDEIKAYGCDFWESYRGKGADFGLDPDDMGPGSYGAVFHDFPMPDGKTFNQFAHAIEQIRNFSHIRTIKVTNWVPYYIGRGGHQKAIVTPCHGDLQFRVMDGELHMSMVQRSADVPIGVPSNMLQYGALLLMMAQVTGLKAGTYSHYLIDAHIYENQIKGVKRLVRRKSKPFPILKVDPGVKDLFSFRVGHFTLEEYDPDPGIKIPFLP